MPKSNRTKFLYKYRLHCCWVGQYQPEAEIERISAWMFPVGSLLDNPDRAAITPKDMELLRLPHWSNDSIAETVEDAKVADAIDRQPNRGGARHPRRRSNRD